MQALGHPFAGGHQSYDCVTTRGSAEWSPTPLQNRKVPKQEEAIALVIAERERTGTTLRIYGPSIGPFDVIAFEWEFENLEEYERLWAEWAATPEAAAFMEKWNEVTKPGGAHEIWTLVE